jgi:hypothetical protein
MPLPCSSGLSRSSACPVANGERVAVTLVGEHELVLVVGAPKIVGCQGLGQGGALGLVAAFAATVDQTVAVEHRVHGADRRRLDIAMQAPQLLPDLRRASTRPLALERNDQLLDL